MTLPFIPFSILVKPSPRFNKVMMSFQYLALMLLLFCVFVLVSALLLPFAYLKSLVVKIRLIFRSSQTTYEMTVSALNFLLFLLTGLPIMFMTSLVDCYYFWENNFREQLNKIVIENEPSTISSDSVKRILFLCNKY